jgi:L-ribulose-5-phosphate 3-epimerase
MQNKLGVMQGRLLPKYQGRYQAFPVGSWQSEFNIAKHCGIDLIEFILDYNDSEDNPLLSDNGVVLIKNLTKESGISVKTICADYFMEAPLHSVDESIAKKSLEVLKRLILSSSNLGVTDIVIPCVDHSSLESKEAVSRFVQQITKIINLIEEKNINLSLETDLAPKPFVKLLNQLNSKNITVNYDIGNSASLGFDSDYELDAYGARISDIHIKDRILNGGPVMLGEGNADFDKFFNKLKFFDYQGPFIMQAYRDEEGVEIFKKQLQWVKQFII